MSASITIERREIGRKLYQDAHLGYLYCGACADPKRGGRMMWHLAPHHLHHGHMDTPRSDVCDRCGKTSDTWPVKVEEVEVTIEHTSARIY